MMRHAPCKNCTDRNADCHSICNLYKEWKIEYEEERIIRNKINKVTNDFIGFRCDSINSLARQSRKNKWVGAS